MKSEAPFPLVPKGLLEALERQHPDRLPKNLVSAAETARLIGQQDVIRKLRHHYDKQQNNILNT